MIRGRAFGIAAWLLIASWYWFDATHAELAAVLGGQLSDAALVGATLMGLAGRLGAQIVETGFYVLAWRLVATRVRLVPMFLAVFTLSLFDAFAISLLRLVGTDPPQAWLALLVGFRALPGFLGEESGVRIAFGSLGLLAVVRMFGTAWAQQREGAPWAGAVALTLGASFASRVATWWTADLVRGMSPMP